MRIDITTVLKDKKGTEIPDMATHVCQDCFSRFAQKYADSLTLGSAIQSALMFDDIDPQTKKRVIDRATAKQRHKLFNRIDRAMEAEEVAVEFSDTEIQDIQDCAVQAYPPTVNGAICVLTDIEYKEPPAPEPAKESETPEGEKPADESAA